MADTIIASPTSEPARILQPDGGEVQWRCLARRGMVFAELEGFDFIRVQPGFSFVAPDHPFSELAVLVAQGYGHARVDGERIALAPGDVILQAPGNGYELTSTGSAPLELVSIEFIPAQLADRLPYRTPQIVDLPQSSRQA